MWTTTTTNERFLIHKSLSMISPLMILSCICMHNIHWIHSKKNLNHESSSSSYFLFFHSLMMHSQWNNYNEIQKLKKIVFYFPFIKINYNFFSLFLSWTYLQFGEEDNLFFFNKKMIIMLMMILETRTIKRKIVTICESWWKKINIFVWNLNLD